MPGSREGNRTSRNSRLNDAGVAEKYVLRRGCAHVFAARPDGEVNADSQDHQGCEGDGNQPAAAGFGLHQSDHLSTLFYIFAATRQLSEIAARWRRVID